MEQFPLEEIVAKVGSRFAVVVAAAERAKQIKDGSPPLVETKSRNPLTIAFVEIAEGKVSIVPAEKSGEDGHVATLDQYFAGRDAADSDGLSFGDAQPVVPSASDAGADDDDAFEFDEHDFDDLDDEDDEGASDGESIVDGSE